MASGPTVARPDVPRPLLAVTALVTMGFGAIFAQLPDYQHALHFADWGLGVVTSASFVAGFTAQLGLARYADRGFGRTMLAGGVALSALGCLGIAVADRLAFLVVARVVLGLGEGIFLPAARRVVITRNPTAIGAGLGRMTATATAGFLVGPPFAAFLGAAAGLRVPFATLGAALVLAIPLVARFRVPGHDEHVPRRSLRLLIRIDGVRRGLWIAAGFAFGIGVYDSLWARFMKDLGASTRFVSISLTIFAAPIALLAPLAGRLADRHGARTVGVIAVVGSTPFIFSYGFVRSYWVIAALSLAHSFFDSGTAPAAQTQVARSSPRALFAAGQGLLDGTSLIAAAVSAAVFAPIYDKWGARPLWVGLACIVFTCAMVAARPTRAERAARSEHGEDVGGRALAAGEHAEHGGVAVVEAGHVDHARDRDVEPVAWDRRLAVDAGREVVEVHDQLDHARDEVVVEQHRGAAADGDGARRRLS
jgi:MFS family permease